MSTPASTHPPGDASAFRQRTGVYAALVAAALLGILVLYGVAFSASPRLHNAAHDVRHVAGIPCH